MSSANVFLKMALLNPEPATPVSLLQHATGRRQFNGQAALRPANNDRYDAFQAISNLA